MKLAIRAMFVCFLLIGTATWAQVTVTVKSGDKPLEGAKVILSTKGDPSVVVLVAPTNEMGIATAPTAPPNGKYNLTVEAKGYSKFASEIEVKNRKGEALAVMQPETAGAPSAGASSASSILKNLGFGVGLGVRWNIIGPRIVSDATVDANGIVRVNTRSDTTAGLVLEMHYFPYKPGNATAHHWCAQCGIGPFVGVEAGENNQVISAVGGGLMVGWKLKPDDENSRTGFGLGLGYAAIPAAKTLGDEFVDRQAAPKGPDGKPLPIRFETRDKGSLLFMLSFTF
jgi:hypothetical protein